MLVIHPKDKTTAMLSALYDGLEAQVVDDYQCSFRHFITTQRNTKASDINDKNVLYLSFISDRIVALVLSGTHSSAWQRSNSAREAFLNPIKADI